MVTVSLDVDTPIRAELASTGRVYLILGDTTVFLTVDQAAQVVAALGEQIEAGR